MGCLDGSYLAKGPLHSWNGTQYLTTLLRRCTYEHMSRLFTPFYESEKWISVI
jgi:hypothetical protein